MIQYYFLLLWLLVIAPDIYAQKVAEDYYHEGMYAKEYLQSYSDAIPHFSYLIKHYPGSRFCAEAYFHMAEYYESKGEDTLALHAYHGSVFDLYSQRHGKAEPVPDWNFKAQAIGKLINLYEKIGNYDSALRMLYYRDTAMGIFHGCVVQSEFFAQYNLTRYADLFLKTNRPKDAEILLLSMYQFKWSNYVGEYEGVVSAKLKEIFTRYEEPQKLKTLIETAVNNYYFDTLYKYDEYYERQDTMVHCCFNFLNLTIKMYYIHLPGPYLYDYGPVIPQPDQPEKEKIIAHLKKSELYVLIQEL